VVTAEEVRRWRFVDPADKEEEGVGVFKKGKGGGKPQKRCVSKQGVVRNCHLVSKPEEEIEEGGRQNGEAQKTTNSKNSKELALQSRVME